MDNSAEQTNPTLQSIISPLTIDTNANGERKFSTADKQPIEVNALVNISTDTSDVKVDRKNTFSRTTSIIEEVHCKKKKFFFH